MVQIKQSFKNKLTKNNKPKKQLGQELSAAIVNNAKNYAKTGQWRFTKPVVSPSCMACELCVKNCPDAVIEISAKDGRKRATIDYNYCKGCGICAEICPIKAIKMEK